MTFLIATKLRLPTEGAGDGEEEGDVTGVLDADTVRDWWRLRVLLIAASTAFSSLYWLHFSAILLGTVILSTFLVPYLIFYGEHLQVHGRLSLSRSLSPGC